MNTTSPKPSSTHCDPEVPDWTKLELEQTWADDIDMTNPGGWWTFLRCVLGKPGRVQVDTRHPMLANIPKYALQEFHNLPNGNYSSRIARGYITGFDISMLGHVQRCRRAMAGRVAECESVLDIGTGGGKLAGAVADAGVRDVWGLDVSPYLLKHAAADHPSPHFVQGPAESLPFTNGRFDAVVACFLFHEMPPKYAAQALTECHRVLRPRGQLLIAEPSEAQMGPLRWRILLGRAGWRHLYFKTLARFVHEPFVMAWHHTDKPAVFAEAGFRLMEHEDRVPVSFFVLERV